MHHEEKTFGQDSGDMTIEQEKVTVGQSNPQEAKMEKSPKFNRSQKTGKNKEQAGKRTETDKRQTLGELIFQSILGLIFAVLASWCLCYTYRCMETVGWQFAGLVILAMIVVALTVLPIRMKGWLEIVITALSPVATFFAAETITHNPWEMNASPIILNLIVFFAFYLLAIFLSTGLRAGSIIVNVCAGIVAFANYFVIQCRNVPILPWDIASLKTAMSVSDNYVLNLEPRACLVILLLMLIVAINCHNRTRITYWPVNIGGIALCITMICTMNMMTHDETFASDYLTASNLFTQKFTYRDNGFVISFMMNLQYMDISKPAGYDTDEISEVLETAEETYVESHENYSDAGTVQPTIIIIMDEAFTDLAYLADFVTVDEDGNEVDYMPFIHSLMEDESVTSGNLHVSVCGGNTANTEFEVLTGNSMAFLPTGSVAYQQYISGTLPSIASVLKQSGYTTNGLHPYGASGWNRNTVYPWLGIDNTYFRDAFTNAQILRKYVSDASAFDKIISVDEKDGSEPELIFEVTMQNHGGYSDIYDNSPLEIFLKDIDNHPATENYLTLVSKTDAALKDLISYYETVEEPTMIVFFGDHQPSDFVADCISNLRGLTEDDMTLEEREDRYIVPFIIWKNYDNGVDAEKYEALSANYLNTVIFEQANLKMSPFQMFLSELRDEYPVINANGYLEKDGSFVPYDSKTAPESLVMYEKIQYNYLHNNQKDNEVYYEVSE